MIPTTTRVVTLRERPERGGEPTPDMFSLDEAAIPALQPGELLVRNIAMSVDPSIRAAVCSIRGPLPPVAAQKLFPFVSS